MFESQIIYNISVIYMYIQDMLYEAIASVTACAKEQLRERLGWSLGLDRNDPHQYQTMQRFWNQTKSITIRLIRNEFRAVFCPALDKAPFKFF